MYISVETHYLLIEPTHSQILDSLHKLLKECWDDEKSAAESTYEAVKSELASTGPVKISAIRDVMLIVALKRANISLLEYAILLSPESPLLRRTWTVLFEISYNRIAANPVAWLMTSYLSIISL